MLTNLDIKSLVQLREVSKPLKNFIDQEKTVWIRMIQKHATNFSESDNWRKSISKISTDAIKELASGVNQFFAFEPSRCNEKWSLLHIAAERGILQIFQIIIERSDMKNPENKSGFTPLHFAAQNGYLAICHVIFGKTTEKNPKTDLDVTPHYLAGKNGHFKVCQFFVNSLEDKNS